MSSQIEIVLSVLSRKSKDKNMVNNMAIKLQDTESKEKILK